MVSTDVYRLGSFQLRGCASQTLEIYSRNDVQKHGLQHLLQVQGMVLRARYLF